ncbi:restriction endonuclease PLD domain-containing protein [Bifidobacterium callitrichos]|uniref:Restriction endonuclease n=1 Tax=Bifidobacterium callitrichos DSM 23973 TaxID=1437609 RepID=A0A086ZVK6_9BIFI|nr:restriction endonuclease PLD domain-containing protein [Bifidobacterium callitrichos]KFI50556.1 restriction endonuclease [Bifidobacterium callitrichos DSM 23973]
MTLLYSTIPPLKTTPGQETINDAFHRLAKESDEISVAVGYISRLSLAELDDVVETSNISRVTLTIGMYSAEGMPERSYHDARALNRKWQSKGIGEIRLVRSFAFHGKLYYFASNNQPIAVINGSANLGVIKTEASNLRQYEVASLVENMTEIFSTKALIDKINASPISENIGEITDLKLIRETNFDLGKSDLAEPVTKEDIDIYRKHQTALTFLLPLKVPTEAERIAGTGSKDSCMKSNINVCYAAPRSARKSRDWYEIQFTVDKEITTQPGYPQKNVPFIVITDDGYRFKAHTTSDGNKQFNAVGDELLLGRWLKGRLVAAGLVSPVNDTMKDTERKGMITREMLDEYGCHHLRLTKTDKTVEDPEDGTLDVWTLFFE